MPPLPSLHPCPLPCEVFETIESQLKAVIIRRHLREAERLAPAYVNPIAAASPDSAAGAAAALTAVSGGGAKHFAAGWGAAAPPSPFDVHQAAAEHPHHHTELDHLPAVTEDAMELGGSGVYGSSTLGPAGSGLSLRRLSVRMSGGVVVRNSAPIPDLLPLKGEPCRAAPWYGHGLTVAGFGLWHACHVA